MTTAAARNGALMTVASMMSVQLGAALAVKLMDGIGPAGVAWLRLAWAGTLMLLFVRPRPKSFTRSALLSCVLLGIATAGFTLLFMVAVSRIPLGTASALEYLGALAVAVAKGRGRGRLLFPAMAGTGVVLLTQPWAAAVDPVGVLAALASAVCLGAYILLTQRVGDEVSGITGLAVSMPVAGLVVTMVAGPSVVGHLTPHLLLAGLGLAILLPAIPFTLEMLALKRLTAAAFGTLMSLEPAFAMMLGLIVLHQVPGLPAVAGIALVVLAGVGAARSGARPVAGTGHREPALVVE
ncbi:MULTISPECIES: EamA family transporter [Mycobacteriaceae]|uniref:EamA family transporter n=1 Tax=Mycolicibacterium mucogenicum DSM 44124 TaxID=1226753 RepID=A0A8H2JC98_MYCMU|nr:MULTISPECIES: EamA family transporter [Mycobacteriaceae]KAB7755120.1 membrane protein [Mycolicibacterium mucogenicum DSM 44124]QPG71933.1 EamA family transporter [Mycolicibacterium mucogenicum DSM 44124]